LGKCRFHDVRVRTPSARVNLGRLTWASGNPVTSPRTHRPNRELRRTRPAAHRPRSGRPLGCYVYAYVDPRSSQIFYIGKGCRGRALTHLGDDREFGKTARINELAALRVPPQIDILVHGIEDAETGLRGGAALIDVFRPSGFVVVSVQSP